MAVRILQIVTLTRDSTMQPREKINKEAVTEYAESFKAGAKPEPIGVVSDGTTHWVWDGFHRIAAYEELCRPSIDCEVTEGNRLDAIRLSLGANAAHGQRRTNEDKRRAVQRALSVPEWNGSDGKDPKTLKEIADWCAVDQATAKKYRDQLLNFKSSNGEVLKAVGNDGKKRPIKYKPRASKPVESQDESAPQEADAAPQDGEGKAGPGKKESNPARRTDSLGSELPGSLFVTFDTLSSYQEIDSLLDRVIRLAGSLVDKPGGEYFNTHKSDLQRLREARSAIKYSRPYALCPKCKGRTCGQCRKTGYVNEALHESLARATA